MIRSKTDLADITLVTLTERFGNNEDICRETLTKLRWPDGVKCLRCESESVSPHRSRPVFDCLSCGYQFSVMVGTVFTDTRLPLWKWFIATYIICESKKGVSANQLKRMLGVTYKTAWYLAHRIRSAMGEAETEALLKGIVEADETWVGGKRRHVGSGYVDNKTMVLGAIERGGDVRLTVHGRGVKADRDVLQAFIKSVVDDGAEAIHTDEHPGYLGIADENTRHETVNHKLEEWVRGQVHTNTVEGVWSLLKRSIIGSYHQLSTKHLDAYLGELEWRFNNRDNPYLFRDTLTRLVSADPLRYKELTA